MTLSRLPIACRSYLDGAEYSNGKCAGHEENVTWLEDFGIAYMEDVRDVSRIWEHVGSLDAEQTSYNRALRKFVCSGIGYGKICWRENLFDRFSDAERTLFYGIRTQPSKSAGTRLPQQIAMITQYGRPPHHPSIWKR